MKQHKVMDLTEAKASTSNLNRSISNHYKKEMHREEKVKRIESSFVCFCVWDNKMVRTEKKQEMSLRLIM